MVNVTDDFLLGTCGLMTVQVPVVVAHDAVPVTPPLQVPYTNASDTGASADVWTVTATVACHAALSVLAVPSRSPTWITGTGTLTVTLRAVLAVAPPLSVTVSITA